MTNKNIMYKIEIDLQNNQHAIYQFSDRQLAKNVFEQTRFVGAIGNLGIKNIRFVEPKLKLVDTRSE